MHSSIRYLAAVPFVAASLSFTGATPASAQQAGLVNVNIEDVIEDISIAIDVSEVDILENVGVVVQAPIGVAANVCNVQANVLAAAIRQPGGADCEAESTSTALNRLVQRSL